MFRRRSAWEDPSLSSQGSARVSEIRARQDEGIACFRGSRGPKEAEDGGFRAPRLLPHNDGVLAAVVPGDTQPDTQQDGSRWLGGRG